MNDQQRRQEAQKNRERMPRFSAWLDTVRAFDPESRVVWAEDGDVVVGKKPEGSDD